ncbi:MAG TPA: SEFIR domain-containing protein [Flavisolibacter sp.]|nr:SEFIR domain-containing protein [Flavisolibacter sp.]
MTATPKVFISYSWTNPEHEDWVINLAERLVSDGVDVIIDKWNLREGQDKYTFMESMVKSEDINRVLIVLDKKYSEKAEHRSGGVGTETQIISPKIYSDVSQEKFIPIVSEKDENGIAFVPTYLEGRIYIDLSEQEHFEENYETLLRNIFKRPAYSKPKLGKAPDYLFEETHMTHRTSSILRSFDNQLNKSPKRINSLIREFLDEFYENLKEYKISAPQTRDIIAWGKEVHDIINSYTPLRNDYIGFLDKVLKSETDFDIENFIRFFERLPLLKDPQDDRGSWTQSEFDNFRFFIHELFIYTIAVGLKNEAYKFVEELLYSSYFFQSKYNSTNEPQRFEVLYNYVDILDEYYKQTFSRNFHSPMADLIIRRVPEGFDKNRLIDADLLCHYVAVFEKLRWFPITYVYRTRGRFELFDRLISMRHFEKVKPLFSVSTVKELQDKIKSIKEADKNPSRVSYSGAFESVVPIYQLIDMEKVGTTR